MTTSASVGRYRNAFLSPAALFAFAFVAETAASVGLALLTATKPIAVPGTDASSFYVVHGAGAFWPAGIFALFGLAYFLWPWLSGRRLDARLGRIHFGIVLLAFNLAIVAIFWILTIDAPRAIAALTDFPSTVKIQATLAPYLELVKVILLGTTFIIVASSLLLFVNIARSMKNAPARPEKR